MSRSLGLMVTTLDAAALLVGCGGGVSDPQPTSEPTTTTSQTTTSFSSSATSTTSSTPASEVTPPPTEPAVQPEVSPAQVTEETVQQQAGFLAPLADVDANVDPDAGAYVEQPAPEAPVVEEQQAPNRHRRPGSMQISLRFVLPVQPRSMRETLATAPILIVTVTA